MTDMLRVLVPIDDSPSALRAVRHVRGAAAALIARRELNDYHREEGMKVLAGAQTLVERAGLPVHLHVGVGDAGETVVAFARRLDCRQIVMGTRGLGGVAGMIMGSVARHVVADSNVPVTLVRAPDC